jgi:hypothetical protein
MAKKRTRRSQTESGPQDFCAARHERSPRPDRPSAAEVGKALLIPMTALQALDDFGCIRGPEGTDLRT